MSTDGFRSKSRRKMDRVMRGEEILPEYSLVRAQWESFERAVDPRGAFRPDQVREMRRAFHAGCQCALHALSEASGRLSEEEGVAILEACHRELERFAPDVREGRA